MYLQQLGIVCSLGSDLQTVREQLFQAESQSHGQFLTHTSRYTRQELPLGMVNTPLPSLDKSINTRTNQLMMVAFRQIEDAYQQLAAHLEPTRIAVILGTSTSGIGEGGDAIHYWRQQQSLPEDFNYSLQEIANPAEVLADAVGAKGPNFVISTACSSGAKALASGRRLLRQGVVDLVIAGGVDGLCPLTVNGFAALDSVSSKPCLPFSANRDGINIGEGAALFLLSRENGPVLLSGVGECSDGHHISAPEPQGKGAEQAMQLALKDARLAPAQIDYLNLHGTATEQNDRMEAMAVNRLFGDHLACSSSKGLTGHTLGAAGAIEAAFCWLSLTHPENALPPHVWDGKVDPELATLTLHTEQRQLTTAPQRLMSNSFAFGGNNISLILERKL